MGSSKLIEYFVALFIGLLAILGALFVIGFLLVEPLRDPNGLPDTLPFPSVVNEVECDPINENMTLPAGCIVGGQQSVVIASCGQGLCTTPDGVCSSATRRCCCRAFEETTVQCDVAPAESNLVNASVCGCSVCDDISVTVVVTVVNAENEEERISGAQIFTIDDNSSPVLQGLTFNGQLPFQASFGLQSITLQVVAPTFRSATRTVILVPGRDITVTVLLTPLIVVVMGLGSSALTVRLAPIAAVSTIPNTFRSSTSGELYVDPVLFRGMYVGSDGNIAAAIEQPAQQFFLNNNTNETFTVFAVFFLGFEDTDENPLTTDAGQLDFVISTEEEELFIAYFNSTDGTWEDGGFLTELGIDDFRRKRQAGGTTPVLIEPNVRVGVFAAVARRLDIECSLQARTFTIENGMPLTGTFITLEQRVGNLLFIFGTDTGAAQTADDGLVNNAICLPIACDNFTSATLEATDGSQILDPGDFPLNTFSISENPPIAIGVIFSIQEVITATPASRRPFYLGFDDCVTSGQNEGSPEADYFSFIRDPPPPPFPVQNCYVKVQVLDCGDGGNVVTVRSILTNSSVVQTSDVAMDLTDIMMANNDFDASPNGTDAPTEEPVCDASTATIRTVCVPFVCQSVIQIIVEPSPDSDLTGTCNNTQRSVIVSLPELSEERTDQLIIDTSTLRADDYNDPDLGLYNDLTNPMIARGRCFAGNSITTADEIDFMTGIAGTFSCFQV